MSLPRSAAGSRVGNAAPPSAATKKVVTHRGPLILPEIERRVCETLGPTKAAPVLSDTRRILRELIMAERRVNEDTARHLLQNEDLRGPLLRAVEFAELQAHRAKREAGERSVRQADRNRISRVAKAVSIVAPESMPRRSHRVVADAVPPAWMPVVHSIVGTDVAACAKRRHIELVVAALARAGILAPSELPTDGDHLGALLQADGLHKPKTITTALSDLRSVLRQCAADGTLPADTPVPRKRIGTKRVRGGAEWAVDRHAKLRVELPLWADDLEDYLLMFEEDDDPTLHARRLATYRVAIGLCEMRDAGLLPGIDLRTLQMQDLGTAQVPRSVRMTSRPTSRAAARNGRGTSSDTWMLVEALGDYLTGVVREEKSGQGVPPIVWKDIERVWAICTALIRPSPLDPLEERVRWQGACEAVRKWTAEAENSRPARENERDKELLAEHLSLPQAIVFGIPYYTLVALPEADERVAAHPIGSVGRRAAEEFRTQLLDEWLALSTKIADPLRVEQRTFGRVGREIEIAATFHPTTGVLESISGVTTHFAGKRVHVRASYGEENWRAGFKQRNKSPRSWEWSPSIVDLEWLSRYFRDVWLPRVQALGEAGSMREAMVSGRWTLFPSTSAGGATSHRWKGMSGDWISEKTGEAMLRVIREVLGYRNVPALRTEAIKVGWRSLLSDHNGRHLWATYWGGVRSTRGPRQVRADGTVVESVSGMDYCRRATTDEEKSIREHYVALSQAIQRLLTRTVGSWAHPLSLDEIMDRVTLTDRAVNWKSEWDTLAAVDGVDAMPPALRERWMRLRQTVRRGRPRRAT